MQILLEQLPLLLLLHKTSSPSARQLRRQHCRHVHLLLQLVNGFRDHLLHNPTLEGGLYSLTIVKRQLIIYHISVDILYQFINEAKRETD